MLTGLLGGWRGRQCNLLLQARRACEPGEGNPYDPVGAVSGEIPKFQKCSFFEEDESDMS